MEASRYFVPEHPTLVEVYNRDELRAFLQRGLLSRSDIVCDDETGLSHLLGDLLSQPYRDATIVSLRQKRPSPQPTSRSATPSSPQSIEFRGDTPLTRSHQPKSSSPSVRDNYPRSSQRSIGGSSNHSRHHHEISQEHEDDEMDHDDRIIGGPESSYSIKSELFHEDPDEAHLSPGGLDLKFPSRDYNHEKTSSTPSAHTPFYHSDLPCFDASNESDGDEFFAEPNQSSLVNEEEILYIGHPSVLAFPRCLLGFAIFATAATYAYTSKLGLEWVMLFGSVAGLFLVYIILERTSTTYFVTTHRIEYEFGIIGRNTKEVRIRDIRAIDVHQRGLKALLGLGTVEFDSSASTGPEVIFKNIRRPHLIKELVRSLQIRH